MGKDSQFAADTQPSCGRAAGTIVRNRRKRLSLRRKNRKSHDKGSYFRHGRRARRQSGRAHRSVRNHLPEVRRSVRPGEIHAVVRHDQRPDPRTADARGDPPDRLAADRPREGGDLPRDLREDDRPDPRAGGFSPRPEGGRLSSRSRLVGQHSERQFRARALRYRKVFRRDRQRRHDQPGQARPGGVPARRPQAGSRSGRVHRGRRMPRSASRRPAGPACP